MPEARSAKEWATKIGLTCANTWKPAPTEKTSEASIHRGGPCDCGQCCVARRLPDIIYAYAAQQTAVLRAALAAYQTVVRELALFVEESDVPQMANEGDLIAWIERRNAVLAAPLVVAARKEGRG